MKAFLVLAVLGMMTAMAPPAAATHGDSATIVIVGGLVLRGDYDFGPGNDEQWWDWTVYSPAGPDRCEDVYGSLENGQVGRCASGRTLVIGGTGEYHPYPYAGPGGVWGLDAHQVVVTYDGQSTDGVHLACDNGGLLGRTGANPCLYQTI